MLHLYIQVQVSLKSSPTKLLFAFYNLVVQFKKQY